MSRGKIRRPSGDNEMPCRTRADGEERRVRPAAGEPLPFPKEERDGGREADAVDGIGVEEPAEKHDELVPRPAPVRGDPPVVGESLALEEPENGLRVADIDGEEHAASESERSAAVVVTVATRE